MATLILLFIACTGASTSDMARCDGIANDGAREDCRLAILWRLADGGDVAGIEAELAKIPDPAARDLARVRLAKTYPKLADRVCAGVEDPAFQEKCKQVTGRPHLTGGAAGAP